MRRTHLFLTELVLDLFLFAVCAAVCCGTAAPRQRHEPGEPAPDRGGLRGPDHRRAVGAPPAYGPAWPAQDGSGLTGVLTVSGDALDIAVYADGALVYTLEGVRCLG